MLKISETVYKDKWVFAHWKEQSMGVKKMEMHENRYCTILFNLTDHHDHNTVVFHINSDGNSVATALSWMSSILRNKIDKNLKIFMEIDEIKS